MKIHFRSVGAVLFLLGAIGTPARAQPIADEVPVPGGPAAVRRLLGLDTTRPREAFFLDLHEALLAGAEWNASWSQIDRRRAVVDFSQDLSAFEKQFGRSFTVSLSEGDRRQTSKLLSWLGVKVDRNGSEVSMEIRDDVRAVRRRSVFDAGVGVPLPALLTKLRSGESVKVALSDGTAPLPFGLETWRELLDEPRLTSGGAFLELVKNVGASRLLVTMHSLDAETREGLRAIARSGKGSVLRDEEVLDRLARFPGALALSGGEFVLPGGREADPIWTDLFGVSPSRPAAFLRALFEKDSGRGAYVVEILQQLPEPVTRALLFGSSGQGAGAVARMRKLYTAIEEARRSVDVSRRDPYDLAHLARFLRAAPSGEVLLLPVDLDGKTFPKNEAELAAIVSRTDRPEEPEDTLARLLKGEVGAGADAPRAARRFLIVSSLLEGRPALEDRGVVALLLRGADRFASAYAILEDVPFQEPELAKRYLFAVDRLDRRKPSRDAEVAAALFQAGVEILAEAYRAGSLDAATARDLFSAFLEVPLFARSELSPAKGERDVHEWLTARLLPACEKWAAAQPPAAPATSDEPSDERSADELLSRALVGSPPAAVFEWNGGHYRFEPASDELARRRAFREKQRLASLEDLSAIRRERDALTGALVRGDRSSIHAGAESLLDRLRLAESEAAPAGEDDRIVEEHDLAREALERVGKTPRAVTAAQAEKELAPVDTVAAERLLEALLGHVYAAAAGDPEDLYYEDPDFVRRHSFRTVEKGGRTVGSAFAPTELTSETTGGGARVTGSLFDLADVLGLLHADQITYRPGAAIANENIRSGLIGPVRRMSSARSDQDALRFVAASCRATQELAASMSGRERAERFRIWRALARDLVPRARLAGLAELGGDGVTLQALSQFLSATDLYRIGRRIAAGALPQSETIPEAAIAAREALSALESRLGAEGARERLAEFGPRAVAWAGRRRLTDLDLPPYENLAAYRAPQLFADRLYDWKIAVARVVADAGLPAAVLTLVLPQAVDEMMGDLRMAFAYDWNAILRRSSAFGAADLGRVLEESLQAGRLLRDHSQDSDVASP